MSEVVQVALIAGTASLVGAALGFFGARAVSRRQDRAARRGDAWFTLGWARSLVDRLAPAAWAIHVSPELWGTYRQLTDAWWDEHRPRLIGLRALYPKVDSDVETACNQIDGLLGAVGQFMDNMQRGGAVPDVDVVTAIAGQANARAALERVMAAAGK
jgi:hypothetical protein